MVMSAQSTMTAVVKATPVYDPAAAITVMRLDIRTTDPASHRALVPTLGQAVPHYGQLRDKERSRPPRPSFHNDSYCMAEGSDGWLGSRGLSSLKLFSSIYATHTVYSFM